MALSMNKDAFLISEKRAIVEGHFSIKGPVIEV
jgi:hypothetical protein